MKKLIAMVMGLSILFGASTMASANASYGVSANLTKTAYTQSKDTNVVLILSNNNKYEVGVDMQPQKLVGSRWSDLDWYDYSFVSSKKSNKNLHGIRANFKPYGYGTYRYKVTVNTFDKFGNEVLKGKFYTKTFKFNK